MGPRNIIIMNRANNTTIEKVAINAESTTWLSWRVPVTKKVKKRK